VLPVDLPDVIVGLDIAWTLIPPARCGRPHTRIITKSRNIRRSTPTIVLGTSAARKLPYPGRLWKRLVGASTTAF